MNRVFYKNLDGLRFIAAMLVVLQHWYPIFFNGTPNAKLGVDIFFVLSGFLISEILLKEAAISNKNNFSIIKIFYFKRALRIFPIYFLLILFLFILKSPDLGDNWVYVFTYTTNFYMYFKNTWIYPISHLWTLAVEEQFYIFWPFFLIFFRQKLTVIISTISISFLYIFIYQSKDSLFHITPFACMSTLGAGALLAFLKINMNDFFKKLYKISVLIIMITCFLLFYLFNSVSFIYAHLISLILSFFLIVYTIISENSLIKFLLANPVISFFGKISYGIYLYHVPFNWLFSKGLVIINTFYDFDSSLFWVSIIQEFFRFSLLLLLCTTSWYLIEKPILKLKANLTG